MPLRLPHKLSPTWPSPRVRESSPRIVAVLALLHVGVAGYFTYTYGNDEDSIGKWLLTTSLSAAVATTVWALLALRVETGRPGWKRLPFAMSLDPDSLPRRTLHWHWLLWWTPLTAIVSTVALLISPTTGDSEPTGADIASQVVITIVAQAFGALAGGVAPAVTVMPLVLVVVGCTRMRDGRKMGLPPTGPVLVSTGLALLTIAPMALGLVTAGTSAQAGHPSMLWAGVAITSTLALFVSLFFLAGYAVYARLSDRSKPDDMDLWPYGS